MSTRTDEQPSDPDGPNDIGQEMDLASAEWLDMDGVAWRVELSPQRLFLTLTSDTQQSIDLPASAWTRDLYLAEHGSRFLIRVETFERSVRFLLEAEEAAPLLRCLTRPVQDKPAASVEEEPRRVRGPIVWPKVSPLAVWAVFCSSLTFVPILGIFPAVATLVLLALHRKNVRRAQAWDHSRALCTVAVVSCICGVLVSALAIWCAFLPKGNDSFRETILASGAEGARNWGMIGAAVLVVFFSLSIHEAAHAISALWLGDDLARSLGRVTLNPLSHIDPFGTVLLPLILAVAGGPVFGYARPVPVRLDALPNHRRAHILISLAGPGLNLLLAAASLMLLLALSCVVRLAVPDAAMTNLSSLEGLFAPVTASGFALATVVASACTVLKLCFLINVFLAMFNLIPLPPLDGSWVLEHMFPATLGRFYAAVRPYGFLLFIGAIYMGLFKYLVIPVLLILLPGLRLVHSVTGF